MTRPAGTPGLNAQLTALREEFPGWTIDAGADADPPWRAVRDTGRSGPLQIGAASYAQMRALLDEVDAVDCLHAVTDLRDVLRGRGLRAEVYGLTVHTQTRAGIVRAVSARRGVYTWTSGVELGPISDPGAVADRMMPGLGLA